MKPFTVTTSLLALLAASANAQVFYNSTTHTLQCPISGHAYCAALMPLSTNIIIRCYGRRAVPGNCADNLAGISPIGVKQSALCFESNSVVGNAACYFNGIVYPDTGNPFQLPYAWSQFLHNTTNGSVATSSTSTMSFHLPTAYGPTKPIAGSTGLPIAPGSGGYNGSSFTGVGTAAPTGTLQLPKATATYIGAAAKVRCGMASILVVLVGPWFLL